MYLTIWICVGASIFAVIANGKSKPNIHVYILFQGTHMQHVSTGGCVQYRGKTILFNYMLFQKIWKKKIEIKPTKHHVL